MNSIILLIVGLLFYQLTYGVEIVAKDITKATEMPLETVEVIEPNYYYQDCIITAYTASYDETGKTDGITASGEMVRRGIVASDHLPFGTKVEINGQTYIVADRFGGDYTNKIDIYVETKEEAFKIGRSVKKVKIYR